MDAIKVTAIGRAADAIGGKDILVPFRPGMTVRALFRQLAVSAIPEYREAIFDTPAGDVSEYITIFVNSREIHSLKGLDTLLSPGDAIMIMPPMAGG